MTYSVLRRGNQYGIVDDSNMFIDEWAGKKSEAEAKAKAKALNEVMTNLDDVIKSEGEEETKTAESCVRKPFTTSNQTEDKKIFKGFKLTEKGWQFIA